jgi:cytochrome c5
MSEEHASLIKTPKQLAIVVVLAFVVPVLLMIMLARLVIGWQKPSDGPESILDRIRPVGEIKLAAPSGPKGALGGEQVYTRVCAACHGAGVAGAHKLGDNAAWAKAIAQGQAAATRNAINGIRAMPARGGNPDLTDAEVERAVVYMANKAGGNWKEPAVAAAAAAPAAGGERTGAQGVQAACGSCHQAGTGGAPRIGDRAAWTTRVARGLDTVLQSALKGHAGMPARGGLADLSDAEVRRAILYMFEQGGGAAVAPAAATPAAATATATTVAAAAPAAAAADGKKVYDTACVACHLTGAANAPKLGDKAAWAPRLQTGKDALYASVLNGKGAMPAKGGNATLADADVKAAVDYMMAQAK